jgi:hypothetical protein
MEEKKLKFGGLLIRKKPPKQEEHGAPGLCGGKPGLFRSVEEAWFPQSTPGGSHFSLGKANEVALRV